MANSSSSSSSSNTTTTNYSNSPCAACKFLRRKCTAECVFAAYFPPEDPQKFANVHKIFGASNVSKLLGEVAPHQREDAVNSLAYEAEARVKDPVYGCVGAIAVLQSQVSRLQKELNATNADLFRYTSNNNNIIRANPNNNPNDNNNHHFGHQYHNSAGFYFGSSPWNDNDNDNHGHHHRGGGGNE